MRALTLVALVPTLLTRARVRLASEVGEGVVSAAIAILVIAVLGAVLFGLAQGWLTDIGGQVDDAVDDIGG